MWAMSDVNGYPKINRVLQKKKISLSLNRLKRRGMKAKSMKIMTTAVKSIKPGPESRKDVGLFAVCHSVKLICTGMSHERRRVRNERSAFFNQFFR